MSKYITIIVPTYNMEKYLERCLSSLLVDDIDLLTAMEVLVVNDGSTDQSSEIAHRFQKLYPNTFRVIDKENGNYGSCVNVGLKMAKGKYVKVLDADDCFNTKALEEYLKLLPHVDADMIVTSGVNINTEGAPTFDWAFQYESNQLYPIEKLHHVWIHDVTHRTDNLRNINYHQTEGISYSDEEWVFYPMFSVKNFYALSIRLYQYTVGRDGQTMNPANWKKAMVNEILVSKGMFSHLNAMEWKNLPIAKYVLEKIGDRLSGFYYRALIQCGLYEDVELRNFDQYLKSECPEWYSMTNDIIAPCNRWTFRYVEYWRQKNYKVGHYFNKFHLYNLWLQIRSLKNKK